MFVEQALMQHLPIDKQCDDPSDGAVISMLYGIQTKKVCRSVAIQALTLHYFNDCTPFFPFRSTRIRAACVYQQNWLLSKEVWMWW